MLLQITEQIAVEGSTMLLNYGVLGLFCLILMVVVIVLWKDNKKTVHQFTSIIQSHIKNEAEYKSTLNELISVVKSLQDLIIELLKK